MYPILQFDIAAGAAQLLTAIGAVMSVLCNYLFLARA